MKLEFTINKYKNKEKMPLLKGKSNVGKNIKTEMSHGKSKAQAIAIALSVAGKSKVQGKGPKELPKKSMPQNKKK